MEDHVKNTDDPKKKALVTLKTAGFWVWITTVKHGEGDRTVKWERLIPGFAPAITLALFFVQAYFDTRIKEDGFFSAVNVKIALQALNAVVLMLILLRGLKISSIGARKLSPTTNQVNIEYIESLEKQFILCMKLFFAATSVLYLFIIGSSIYNKAEEVRLIEKNSSLFNIRAGRDRINSSAILLRNIIVDSKTDNLKADNFQSINGELDTIYTSMRAIMFNDPIYLSSEDANALHLQTIRRANEVIGKAVFEIDNTVNSSFKGDTLILLNGYIKNMYQGYHLINVNSRGQRKGAEALILFIHCPILLCNNIGSLCLFYAFIILYTKTRLKSYRGRQMPLLSLTHLFYTPKRRDDRKIISLLRMAYGIVIGFTLLQGLFELTFQDSAGDINTSFTMISAILSALVLTLLVTKFEIISPKSTFNILIILYLYANIQGLFVALNNPWIGYVALIIAFSGKCFLYLYVLWILRTDRLKFYFYNCFDESATHKEKMPWHGFLETLTTQS